MGWRGGGVVVTPDLFLFLCRYLRRGFLIPMHGRSPSTLLHVVIHAARSIRHAAMYGPYKEGRKVGKGGRGGRVLGGEIDRCSCCFQRARSAEPEFVSSHHMRNPIIYCSCMLRAPAAPPANVDTHPAVTRCAHGCAGGALCGVRRCRWPPGDFRPMYVKLGLTTPGSTACLKRNRSRNRATLAPQRMHGHAQPTAPKRRLLDQRTTAPPSDPQLGPHMRPTPRETPLLPLTPPPPNMGPAWLCCR